MFRKVGIIGCGTIGSELALAIDSGKVKKASLLLLYDKVENAVVKLKSKLENSNTTTFSNFSQFISSSAFANTDIIVEAASQDAVRKFAKTIIQSGKDLIIMSVGALTDGDLLHELSDIASKKEVHIYVPSGAIAGIDAIRSIRHLLKSVTISTTKTPKALAGAPFFEKTRIKPESITKKRLIYEGTARDAVKKFPSNVNVAAALGLAGVGMDATKVKIIADPAISVNQHEITAKGKFGEIKILLQNTPSPSNPKTSYLAVLSAVECLRSISDDNIRIGT
ncbi:MAG TPA: aspartate dehydrogenase [Nitrososphaeraceae archaeon]|nr:aspartate dehydrogenase [Nitrososphaeraceae archaeon]